MRSWNPIERVWVFVLGSLLASNSSWASCPGGHFTATSATGVTEARTGASGSPVCRVLGGFSWPPEAGDEATCGDPCAVVPTCSCDGPCALARASFQPQPDGYLVDMVLSVGKNPDSNGGTGPGPFLLPRFATADVYVTGEAVGGPVQCTFTGQQEVAYYGRTTTYPIANVQIFSEGLHYMPNPLNGYCYASSESVVDPTNPSDPAKQPSQAHCFVTFTCQPYIPPSQNFSWNDPQGGNYSDALNWSPNCGFPEHNGQVSDIASFLLASPQFIPVSGFGATASRWVVTNGCPIEFSGSGRVFSTSLSPPSLSILQGGQLRLVSGASLDSIHASIGASGTTNSVLEVKGARWTNTASAKIGRGSLDVLDGGRGSTKTLTIGSGNGAGTVHVTGDASSFEVTDAFVVGETTAGTLEIDKGLFLATSVTKYQLIGDSAAGTVTVRGDDSNFSSYGRLQVDRGLTVGEGASGHLNVQRGGYVVVAEDLVVSGYGANPAGEVVVDGQGGVSTLDVQGGIFVNATLLQEIVVQNGGRLSTNELNIGSGVQVGGGAADVTVRDPSGSFPTLTVGLPGGGGAGTHVGSAVPGQLNIGPGAIAELYNGLYVGEAAQGIVTVTGQNAPAGSGTSLTVNGETQVGIGAPGILQLDYDALMTIRGDLKIGLGGNNPSGSVNLTFPASLWVHGALQVGYAGIGLLQHGGAGVHCDTLVVGGNAPSATGIVTVASTGSGSTFEVRGNASVGVGSGRGEILLADPTAHMAIDGTMTIGNPSGGPGGGAVVLVDAQVFGTGSIVVNPNGSLSGTGTVSVPKIRAGGIISPGLSPGTLTIGGELEMLPSGKLVIEYAGQNPGEFDVLHVTGRTTLGGRLEVHFRNDFSPPDPRVFIHSQSFVAADQGTTGDYDERVYAFPDRFADFDDDGDKDLLDVAAFQNCFGLSGTELVPACVRADWEGDGMIGGREVQELSDRLSGPN